MCVWCVCDVWCAYDMCVMCVCSGVWSVTRVCDVCVWRMCVMWCVWRMVCSGAKQLLLENPALSYALLQIQVALGSLTPSELQSFTSGKVFYHLRVSEVLCMYVCVCVCVNCVCVCVCMEVCVLRFSHFFRCLCFSICFLTVAVLLTHTHTHTNTYTHTGFHFVSSDTHARTQAEVKPHSYVHGLY